MKNGIQSLQLLAYGMRCTGKVLTKPLDFTVHRRATGKSHLDLSSTPLHAALWCKQTLCICVYIYSQKGSGLLERFLGGYIENLQWVAAIRELT